MERDPPYLAPRLRPAPTAWRLSRQFLARGSVFAIMQPDDDEKSHEERVMRRKRKVRCPHCEGDWVSRRERTSFERLIHLNSRKFLCEKCRVEFFVPRGVGASVARMRSRLSGERFVDRHA